MTKYWCCFFKRYYGMANVEGKFRTLQEVTAAEGERLIAAADSDLTCIDSVGRYKLSQVLVLDRKRMRPVRWSCDLDRRVDTMMSSGVARSLGVDDGAF